MEAADIATVKATWLCVRQDPEASGCLLFKMLFARHPEYLQLFPQFPDLDLDNMRANKRLLKHAVTVIKTVSFVVDAVGDPSQGAALNEALVSLVKSHLKKRIGLDKFENLGAVLIDFIADLNEADGQSHIATSAPAADQLKAADVDAKALTSSWAKLYDIILALVRQQQEENSNPSA